MLILPKIYLYSNIQTCLTKYLSAVAHVVRHVKLTITGTNWFLSIKVIGRLRKHLFCEGIFPTDKNLAGETIWLAFPCPGKGWAIPMGQEEEPLLGHIHYRVPWSWSYCTVGGLGRSFDRTVLWISWVAIVFLGSPSILMGSPRRLLSVGMVCSFFFFSQMVHGTWDL